LAGLGDEERKVSGWFEALCRRDERRARLLLGQLQLILDSAPLPSAQGHGAERKRRDSGGDLDLDDSDSGGAGTTCESAASSPRHRAIPHDGRPGAGSSGDSSNMAVFVRKRPMFEHERENDFDVVDASGFIQPDSIVVFDARMKADMRGMKFTPNLYAFDQVFDHSATNEEVFAATTAPLVDHALAGHLACWPPGHGLHVWPDWVGKDFHHDEYDCPGRRADLPGSGEGSSYSRAGPAPDRAQGRDV